MSNHNQGSRLILTNEERGRRQREAHRRYREKNVEILREKGLERYYRRKAKLEAERKAQQNRPTIVIVENDGTEADISKYEQPSTSGTSLNENPCLPEKAPSSGVRPQDELKITISGSKDECPPPVLPYTPPKLNLIIVDETISGN